MTSIILEAVIEEARRRARRRRLGLAVGFAVLAAVGIWAGLTLAAGAGTPKAGAPAGFVRVPARGPVQYLVLEQRAYDAASGTRTMSLTTGSDAPSAVTEEYWYDAAGKMSRDRLLVDGLVRKDIAATCAGRCAPASYLERDFNPARSGFADAGPGAFRGRPVRWFTRREGAALEKVAIGQESSEVVGFRAFYRGRLIGEVAVLRRAELSAEDVSFVVPEGGAARPVYGNTAAPTTGVTLGYGFAAAREALSQVPLWLGPRFHRLPLRSVSVGVYSFPNKAGNRLRPAPYVRLDYGGDFDYASKVARGALTLEEFGAARPWFYEHGPRWGTAVRDWLVGAGLSRQGVLVRVLNASDDYTLAPANVLRIARALHPLPAGVKTLATLRQQ